MENNKAGHLEGGAKPDFSDSTYTREENPQFSQSINAREKSEFSEVFHLARGTVIRMAG